MNSYELKKLFQRHIDGTLSEEELVKLRAALLQSEQNEDVQQMLDSVWGESPESDVSKERAELIYESITSTRKIKKHNLFWVKIAASIFIIMSIAFVFNYINRQQSKETQETNFKAQIRQINPGQNKAVLTLSNGNTIALKDQNNGQLATQGGVTISKLNDGQLVYSVSAKQPSGTTQFNTISTPKGGQYMVVLPDGTKAWLNAHSSLRYPVYFAGKERVVEVEGEAYFEVTKNKLMPFKVIANDVEVKVLGTHFNVTAYADEQTIRTTLLEGSVDVNSKILLPGQQAQMNNQSKKLSVSKVNTDEVVAWKNGIFIFRNEDIQTIMKKISRWYDVEIEFKDKNIINKRFGGIFSRSGELSDMLESMSLTGMIHFKTEGRRIIVMN